MVRIIQFNNKKYKIRHYMKLSVEPSGRSITTECRTRGGGGAKREVYIADDGGKNIKRYRRSTWEGKMVGRKKRRIRRPKELTRSNICGPVTE